MALGILSVGVFFENFPKNGPASKKTSGKHTLLCLIMLVMLQLTHHAIHTVDGSHISHVILVAHTIEASHASLGLLRKNSLLSLIMLVMLQLTRHSAIHATAYLSC